MRCALTSAKLCHSQAVDEAQLLDAPIEEADQARRDLLLPPYADRVARADPARARRGVVLAGLLGRDQHLHHNPGGRCASDQLGEVGAREPPRPRAD